jgi:hypothetical protein
MCSSRLPETSARKITKMNMPTIGKIDYLDNWLDTRNSYEWFSLIATLDFGRDFIDLASFESGLGVPSPEADAFLPVFVHEYTHFLQNISTLWGALNLHDLIQVAFLISCGTERKNQQMKSLGWSKLQALYTRFKSTPAQSTNAGLGAIEFNSGCSIPVKASNGNLSVLIDVKCIRENMARCAAELFLGKGDEAIHETGAQSKAFHSIDEGSQWCRQPEYWVLFEYFYAKGFERVAMGVLRLCTYLLNYQCPTSAFWRFSMWIKDCDRGDLWEIAERWYVTEIEIAARKQSWSSFTESLKATCKIGQEYGSENDIVKEFGALANLVDSNLKQDGSLFLDGIDEISSLQFWAKRIRTAGSPVLRFHDQTEVWGATAAHKQALINLSGITEVLSKRGRSDFCCTFFRIYPICIATKDDHLCGTSPHKWDTDHGCLFVNSMKILGMENGQNWQT